MACIFKARIILHATFIDLIVHCKGSVLQCWLTVFLFAYLPFFLSYFFGQHPGGMEILMEHVGRCLSGVCMHFFSVSSCLDFCVLIFTVLPCLLLKFDSFPIESSVLLFIVRNL